MWFEQMHQGWQFALADWRDRIDGLERLLQNQRQLAPEKTSVMAALSQDPQSIRVVILGQDPYPTQGMAVGRAFAISQNQTSLPASLRNIFKEMEADIGGEQPDQTLAGWQEQGVLLLNRHLTTIEGRAAAHLALGWDEFSDAVISHLIARPAPLVLLLWGKQAQSVVARHSNKIAEAGSHLAIVQGPHPSPLSAYRGFFGSKPFSSVNVELKKLGATPIDWNR